MSYPGFSVEIFAASLRPARTWDLHLLYGELVVIGQLFTSLDSGKTLTVTNS